MTRSTAELLRVAHPIVCDAKCPAVFKTGTEPPHCDLCKEIGEALALPASVPAPVGDRDAKKIVKTFDELMSRLKTSRTGLGFYQPDITAFADHAFKNYDKIRTALLAGTGDAEAMRVRVHVKTTSYETDGTVLARFQTTKGDDRVVVEFDTPRGLLHIHNPSQLEALSTPPVQAASAVTAEAEAMREACAKLCYREARTITSGKNGDRKRRINKIDAHAAKVLSDVGDKIRALS